MISLHQVYQLNSKDIKLAARLWLNGQDSKDISKVLGCPENFVAQHMTTIRSISKTLERVS